MKRLLAAALVVLLAGCSQPGVEPAATRVPGSASVEIGPTNPAIFDAIRAAEERTGGTAFDIRLLDEGYRVRTLVGSGIIVVNVSADGVVTNSAGSPWRTADDKRAEGEAVSAHLELARISLADAVDAAAAAVPGTVSRAVIASAAENQVRFDVTIMADGRDFDVAIDGVTGRRV